MNKVYNPALFKVCKNEMITDFKFDQTKGTSSSFVTFSLTNYYN